MSRCNVSSVYLHALLQQSSPALPLAPPPPPPRTEAERSDDEVDDEDDGV